MNRAFAGLTTAVILCLSLGACNTQPIYQVDAHPVTQAVQMKVTNEQMTKIILEAAANQKWLAEVVQPGRIRATIHIHETHSATCDILFSKQTFSIHLASSSNLAQDSAGNIHPNYNKAVHRLEEEIERGLYRASY